MGFFKKSSNAGAGTTGRSAPGSYQAYLDSFRIAWPELPAEWLKGNRQRWAPLVEMLSRGLRPSTDEEVFLGNMASIWALVGYPGEPNETSRRFFDLLVQGIGGSLEMLRADFAARALPITETERQERIALILSAL